MMGEQYEMVYVPWMRITRVSFFMSLAGEGERGREGEGERGTEGEGEGE